MIGQPRCRGRWGWVLLFAGALATSLPAAAAIELKVHSTPAPPIIDGSLDDPCWAQAAHASGFYFPQENRAETEPTEAWVCVDADNLYAAFYCHDSQPETILSQQTSRGGSVERDDYIALHVDTTRQKVEHYTFRVSANGTQNETIPNSGSGNYAWRGDWTAAAQRVIDGYIVELAVPFTTLQYPRGQTEFGIAFGRNLERLEEGDIWPEMHDRFEEQYMAALGPLTLKDIRIKPVILPYAIGRINDDGATIQSGLDVKHVFGTGVRGLFTLNPDFATIEDVVETIAFSDTERLLGETRPFFAEGSRFMTPTSTFNSRRIRDVTSGFKAFGEVGRSQFGALGVVGDKGQIDGLVNYGFKFTPDIILSSGLVYAGDRNFDLNGDGLHEPANIVSTTSFDGGKNIGSGRLNWGGDFRHSFTPGPGGEGNTWNVYADWGGERLLGWNVSYSLTDPSYRTVLGHLPENDSRGFSCGLNWKHRTQDRFVQNRSWYLNHGEYNHADGTLLNATYSAGADLRFANGTSLGLDWFVQQRPPNKDRTYSAAFTWGLESLYNEGGISCTFGDRGGGEYLFARLYQGWAPISKLRFNVSTEFTHRDFFDPTLPTRDITQMICTATYELSPYSNVSARFIEREGNLNLFLAYRNAPTSGRAWFLFFGDPNSRRTELMFQAKVLWPL